MRRRLVSTLTALSGVVCAAVAVLWVRSHFVYERVTWQEPLFHSDADERVKSGGVFCGRGCAGMYFHTARKALPKTNPLPSGFVMADPAPPPGVEWDRKWKMPEPRDATRPWEYVGLRLDREPASFTADGNYGVQFPLLPVAVAFSLPPALRAYRRRERYPAGYYRRCGYDLLGNLSGTCPECGERWRESSSAGGQVDHRAG